MHFGLHAERRRTLTNTPDNQDKGQRAAKGQGKDRTKTSQRIPTACVCSPFVVCRLSMARILAVSCPVWHVRRWDLHMHMAKSKVHPSKIEQIVNTMSISRSPSSSRCRLFSLELNLLNSRYLHLVSSSSFVSIVLIWVNRCSIWKHARCESTLSVCSEYALSTGSAPRRLPTDACV